MSDSYAEGLRKVGEAQYCNGFMACTLRVGHLLLANPRMDNKELFDALTAEYKALPGFNAVPDKEKP